MKTAHGRGWGEALRGRPEDKRAFRRFGVSLTVLVQAASAPAAGPRPARVAAVVTEASVSGLVFVSHRPYPAGSPVEMQIRLGARVHLIRAVVRRSQVLWLPGRRAFQCAVQLARTEATAEFIPAMARYLLSQAKE